MLVRSAAPVLPKSPRFEKRRLFLLKIVSAKDFVFTSNLPKMEVLIRLTEARGDFALKL